MALLLLQLIWNNWQKVDFVKFGNEEIRLRLAKNVLTRARLRIKKVEKKFEVVANNLLTQRAIHLPLSE